MRQTRSAVAPPAWAGSGLALVLAAAGALALPTATPARAADTAGALPLGCTAGGAKVTCSYTEPSEIPVAFAVPTGVQKLRMIVRGGSGGSGDADQARECLFGTISRPGGVEGARGGLGGVATAVLSVVPGEVLDLYVGGNGQAANRMLGGGGGANGGAPGGSVRFIDVQRSLCDPFSDFGGGGGGGGGGSYVMPHGAAPSADRPLLVAGGGGGGAGTWGELAGGVGGAGGGPNGEPGADGTTGGRGGADGGGRGGPGASNGMRGFGGSGAHSASSPGGGGGGGGGYFGGGGGGSSGDTAVPPANRDLTGATRSAPMDTAGGGGGGSGYIAPSEPGSELSKAKIGPGSISGPGEITIFYTRPREHTNTAPTSGRPAARGPGREARAVRPG